ncbi:hypothetical protein [Dethiosulfatarculus sandiegensis]|uniref:Uncharacterized protein n=1 Tax=Dethiosulfatarculus sandiegensis TaxID=1429043 RepID=A0A0D2JHH8_9BACT|nr:hypothetical protein [Dethiosulfatarculus sandiegensis]KIX15196.1 hypothetical protein X474_04755 [Dethiosulfatarculus sandiegensis]
MNLNDANIGGLTKVILEALITITPEVVESGETWSPELLDAVENKVHEALSPKGSGKEQILFDFLFARSFKEAKTLFLEVVSMPIHDSAEMGDLGLRQAMA